ncbi:hypothetical protein DS742_26095 [Lacrimispora amygdalina]|uniref:Glycosyltransferase RgtA/B/C/D-like domain-containing protein n=1 Tax=Lacrimispora amygdalina TaxID=253257 RepID=A0A3E2N4R2_9FIRM|nr:hypothetical protein [Clostridium indicum]RFZ75987.1 hypothetical protein DS742_26095 [Clostridium indicum]
MLLMENLKMKLICKNAVKLFYLIAGSMFFWLILNVILNNCFVDPNSYGGDFVITSYYNPFIIIFFVIIIYLILTKVNSSNVISKKAVSIVLLTLIISIQVFLAQKLAYDISDTTKFSDFGIIVDSAKCILSGGTYNNKYFQNTPYQVGIISEIIIWNRVLMSMGFKSFNVNCIALNIISIDLAILGGFFMSKIIWKSSKMSNLFLIFSLLFSPYYTYITYYYTDSLSIPFAIWGVYIYAYLNANISKLNFRRTVLLWATMILIFVLGIFIKATVGIAIIAIFLHMIFSRQSIVKIGCVILLFFIVLSSFKTVVYNYIDDKNWFGYEIANGEGYPKEFWFLMGTNEKRLGAYPPEDVSAIIGLETRKEQRDTAIQLTIDRLKDYGVAGYIKFLTTKNNWIWGDGRYFATELLGWFPHINNSKILNFFINNKIGNPIFCYWSQCIQVLILFLLLGSFFTGVRTGEIDIIFVINITIFGVLIFFSLWESRPRYLFNYTPFLLVSAINGFEKVRGSGKVIFYNIFND